MTATPHGAGRWGRDADSRRLVLAMLLTNRYHLTSRPISFANQSYTEKLSRCSDFLLDALREPGWARLSPREEEGIDALEPTTAWPPPGDKTRRVLPELFGQQFRRYFSGLNLPWSTLVPVDDLEIGLWPRPRRILFSVGPNIGIGDELIFSEVAARLARLFDGVQLEVSSFNQSLWDGCDFVDRIYYEGHDQLAPFVRARELAAQDDTTLLVFAEFASAHIYRHLETTPGFPRFVYFDTGARLVRLVDRTRFAIREHTCRTTHHVYEDIATFLRCIGVPVESADLGRQRADDTRSTPSNGRAPRIFLNPFTSKNVNRIQPAWWATCLNVAASARSHEVRLFAGINERTREYASHIVQALDPGRFEIDWFGAEQVRSIADTLSAAEDCDAIFGADTFTAHFGHLKSIPSVTVFFGSSWQAWRPPGVHSFRASLSDDAAEVGRLLSLCTRSDHDADYRACCARLVAAVEHAREAALEGERAAALGAIGEARCHVRALLVRNPDLSGALADVPIEYVDSLERALGSPIPVRKDSAALRQLVERAYRTWCDSNLCRHASGTMIAPP